MDEISLEDLALLDFLKRVDQGVELAQGDTVIRQRMMADGLLDEDGDGLRLTSAGIELCKSLQHRVAADAQIEKILRQRAGCEAAENDAQPESAES